MSESTSIGDCVWVGVGVMRGDVGDEIHLLCDNPDFLFDVCRGRSIFRGTGVREVSL